MQSLFQHGLSRYSNMSKYMLLSQEKKNNLQIFLTWEDRITTKEVYIRETSLLIVSEMKCHAKVTFLSSFKNQNITRKQITSNRTQGKKGLHLLISISAWLLL